MKHAIEEFISCKRIAVVGLSRNGKKFGNAAFLELARRGYQVFGVHPEAKEIAGARCVPTLGALKGSVDGVVISIKPPEVMNVLREAAAIGVKNVWVQKGAESREAVALGEELKLNLVTGKCVLMYAPPVGGFHGWHRSFNRLIGRL